MYSPKGWTYGAEFELSDWDRRKPFPKHLGLDMDWTMVNSNGIAVDPRARIYHLGGEVLAAPSETQDGVAQQLDEFMALYPETVVNYRSNLHVHVRVPGLREDLKLLKRLQRFCHVWLPTILPIIEPIPEPTQDEYPDLHAYKGARKRFARRKISHQKIMPYVPYTRQMSADTPQRFFEAEALHVASGRLLWATRPRCAVNIRQLLQTDTVEFRHFPGTMDYCDCLNSIKWCGEFLQIALADDDTDCRYRGSPRDLWHIHYRGLAWPTFRPYVHWMEMRYQKTCSHNVGPVEARKAIARYLDEDEGSGKKPL